MPTHHDHSPAGPARPDPAAIAAPAPCAAAPPQRHLVGPALAAGVAALLVSLWFAASWPERAGAQQGGAAAIDMLDFEFGQTELSVPAGTTITWTNGGEHPHTATDRGGTFDTQPLLAGESGSVTLDTPGTYSYFCRINPVKMNGTITVTPAGPPSGTTRVQMVDGTNIEGEAFRFDPPQLSVPLGSKLLVANVGGKPHSLTAEDGSFNSGILKPGAENGRFAGTNTTITPDKAGTFAFFCEIHPAQMKGVLTVTGSAPPSTATTAAPPPSTSSPPATAPPNGNVGIVDFTFEPSQLSVGAGGQVTFSNGDQAAHTATFDDVELDTGTLEGGASATLTVPTQPGSYSYFCNIHPSMRGVLVVLGADTADPTALVSTTTAAAARTDVTRDDSPTGTADVAAPPAAADTGSGGLMQGWVLITVAAGCLLAGIGVASFLGRRRAA